jgi:hypothetical protein
MEDVMKLKERGIADASLLVVLAIAALVIATRVRESEARAPGVAAVRLAPEPAEPASGAAPENSLEIIGVIEPLLVGSPSRIATIPDAAPGGDAILRQAWPRRGSNGGDTRGASPSSLCSAGCRGLHR